jgi:hypothetical protein
MEDIFADLLDEAAKSVSGKLLEDLVLVGKKSAFVKDPVLDHVFFHIFCDILVSETKSSKMVVEFIKAKAEVQDAFDAKLRDRVYDALYEAKGGIT